MNKTAFFLDNVEINDIDCSKILEGNPGIGGTEFLIITIATLLTQRKNNQDIKLFCTREQKFPEWLDYEVCPGISDAMTVAAKESRTRFVTKHLAENVSQDIFKNTPEGLRIIIWSHIFMSFWEMDYYAENAAIEKIVFVGRETADLYRDHKAFEKTTFIFNCVSLDGLKAKASEIPFNSRMHTVTYMGSLVPFKGFHLLAKAWPTIIKKVPDAELYVIGSGRLYNQKASLGKYGIAEEEYENSFMPYLTDENGCVLESVHFMGRMGKGKNGILAKTKVGVPNPSGISETFCLCAVEMQAAGAMVTTIDYPGFMDTVRNGILYRNPSKLAENVINLLLHGESSYDSAMDYFEENFSCEAVARQWERLLSGRQSTYASDRMSNSFYRLKWLKEAKRKICVRCPKMFKLPITERILLFLERKTRGRITYLDS